MLLPCAAVPEGMLTELAFVWLFSSVNEHVLLVTILDVLGQTVENFTTYFTGNFFLANNNVLVEQCLADKLTAALWTRPRWAVMLSGMLSKELDAGKSCSTLRTLLRAVFCCVCDRMLVEFLLSNKAFWTHRTLEGLFFNMSIIMIFVFRISSAGRISRTAAVVEILPAELTHKIFPTHFHVLFKTFL